MISQYVNLYFPFCSLMVNLLLFIIFLSKKRLKNIDNKIYTKLLFFSLVESMLMFGTNLCVCIFYEPPYYYIFEILNKILYSIYIIWLTIMFFYIYKIGNNKNISVLNALSSVLNIILITLIFIVPIDLYYENGLTNSSGMSSNVLYIGCSIYMLAMSVVSIINYKKIKNRKKYIPLILLMVLMMGMLIIRKVDPLLNISSNVFSIVTLLMYFTIENPDTKMVDELVKNRKIIERTSEEKAVFLFKMSQELKEPVSNISKQVQKYKNNKLNKSDTDIVIDNIDGNNRKIGYLITDVLGISSNDNRNIKILENTYNIYSIINELEKRTGKLITNNIDLNFTCAENIPKELYGDSLKLKQVLMSVIVNAIEHTKEGYVHVDVNSITKLDTCRLVISVKDSGTGIDLLTINEILDQDIEVSDKEYLKLEELDVDLKIAYKIIKLLNGTMYIRSEVDKGTEIIIALNQYIKDDKLSKENAIINSYIKTRTNAKKVLIVNDDANELKRLRIKLENMGYEVYSSLYGEDTIDKITNNEKYDLILIDDEMKLMSGMSLLNRLIELDNKSKKIVLLEKNKVSISHHYIKDGFDDYIDKSELFKELENKCKY